MPESGNLLVGIRMKKTSKVDLKGPIVSYIKRVYGDRMAIDATESLDELQDLRNQVHSAGTNVCGIGMETFSRYYTALRAIEIRFPVSSDPSHVSINFKWNDAFRDTQSCSQKNIYLEQAAIVFCMAAISSQKGVDVNRTSLQGIAEAVKSFAMSAGLLKHLRENLVIKTDHKRTVDMTGECCTMLQALMLAQAQEMSYELMHSKKANNPQVFTCGLLAQVASSCADLYGDVATKYEAPSLQNHFDKEWAVTSRVKNLMYRAEADYLHAMHLEPMAGAKFAEYLGHLRRASSTLQTKHKEVKLAGTELQRQYKALEVKIEKQLEDAERAQRNIYMQLVPDELSRVPPKQVVHPHDPAEHLNSPQQWFDEIVPDAVTRHLSKYTAETDEIVRDLLTKMENATDDARTALVQHDLPAVLEAMNPSKPPELPEKARRVLQEDFVACGPAVQLREASSELVTQRERAAADLRTCTQLLEEEERADLVLRQQWGERWTLPHSNVLAATHRSTISTYHTLLQTAAEKDTMPLQKLETNRGRLEGISIDNARSRLPHLEQPMVSIGTTDPATVVANLRGSLAGLEALGSERDVLEDRVKGVKEADNILPELLQSGTSDTGPIFDSHLQQYEPLKRDVEKNLERQAELLKVISANMGSFKTVFDVVGWQQECERASDQIVDDVETGKQLLSQLGEGIRWYYDMQENIKKLEQMLQGFATARSVEREMFLENLKKQSDKERAEKANEEAARRLAEMDLSATGTTGGHAPPPPAAHMSHPYPVPPHGPAATQGSPYASYPPLPSGGGDWSHPHPQQGGRAPYGAPQHQQPRQGHGYGAPPPHNPSQPHPHHAHQGSSGSHHQPPYGAPPPYGPQEGQQPYGDQAYGQHSGYYQAQTYPQGPYGQYPPPGYQ